MKKDTMPMEAVELMVSIDFKNRCATDKRISEMDKRDIIAKNDALIRLEGAADFLVAHCDKQEGLGIRHIWVQKALDRLEDFVEEERKNLSRELRRAEDRIVTIDRQVKEFDEKDKKRKKK